VKLFQITLFFFKDKLKNIFHYSCFFPYRKPSKRYKIWNRSRERVFTKKIVAQYQRDKSFFDSIEVSIIMPAFNRAYCIEKPIKSVLNQHHSNWELLIIDDGSTDGLGSFLENNFNDKRIKYYKKEWGGVSQARNFGLDRASGKYIFYLDTDNVWYPDYLRNMIVFMEKGNLDTCYSGTKIIDDNGEIIGYYGEPFVWNECWELNHIDINSFAHRTGLLGKGFRFDENLKRLVDWDFMLTLTANHRTAYAPFLGIEYYDGQHGSRITFTQHLGDEIKELISYVQEKHRSLRDASCTGSKNLRPHWKQILK